MAKTSTWHKPSVIALTIDQRRSRGREIAVDDWVMELNAEFRGRLVLPFGATVGDELQGVTEDSRVPVELVLRGARHEHWWVGIGIGPVDLPLRETAARSRGDAFYRAREAVDRAKTHPAGFAVIGASERPAADAETVLALLAFVVAQRGDGPRARKTWEAIGMRSEGAGLEEIGRMLNISRQAVGQRLRRAAYEEERSGRELAARLLEAAGELG
jgi:hypothetical protein